MAEHRIKKGEITNPKGCPVGAHHIGRPPDEFKAWIHDIIHSDKARERFIKIIQDDEGAEEKVTEQGVCVPTRTQARVYLQALELGLAYAEGRPTQYHDVKTNKIPSLANEHTPEELQKMKDENQSGK